MRAWIVFLVVSAVTLLVLAVLAMASSAGPGGYIPNAEPTAVATVEPTPTDSLLPYPSTTPEPPHDPMPTPSVWFPAYQSTPTPVATPPPDGFSYSWVRDGRGGWCAVPRKGWGYNNGVPAGSACS